MIRNYSRIFGFFNKDKPDKTGIILRKIGTLSLGAGYLLQPAFVVTALAMVLVPIFIK